MHCVYEYGDGRFYVALDLYVSCSHSMRDIDI